ncbi:protein SAWADEE HOMEODOMAIN HOMOLOG 1 [Rhodamnia argentea]|uniref:Protein SAWADEE HOMEODOMAIN HOMOLOG 1 n=1 Tax=Rhodamnia argentea TaxID=178133 RepID=A0A8B8NUS3_9MYRT|nr:protein SAWADEE HOMEODOMAIN HOMOLOG 1 [Rhodamnia argentea]
MEGVGSRDSTSFHSLFSLSEIVEMENILNEMGEKSLHQEFCEELATRLSSSAIRAGRAALTWQQVQSWFQDKHKELQAETVSSPIALKLFVDLSEATVSRDASESTQKPEGDDAIDLSELAFEAKSFKDEAWYDVASFLTFRVLCTGELEARVRFAGFDKGEDEWVSVRKGIRERSIPLEPSECHRVNTGDLVLCFQERFNQAVYCDAHIMEIRRKLHDDSSCTCVFIVRYDHDFSQEIVELSRLCCRPRQEACPQLPETSQHETALSISARSLWE